MRYAEVKSQKSKIICRKLFSDREWLFYLRLAVLVRKLLKRASFLSKDDLKNRIFDFINYFNQTMAKPFKWTYRGKVLAI